MKSGIPEATDVRNWNRAQLLDFTRALLETHGRPGEALDDESRAKALSLAFATGVEIHEADGEIWTPSPDHMRISDANFESAVHAFDEGRLRFTATNIDRVVAIASADKAAFDAIRIILDDFERRREPLPAALEEMPATRPRKGDRHLYRDHAIQVAIYWLTEFGLHATGNDESGSVNACDLVAESLCMDKRAVRKVWNKRPWKR